MSILDVLSGGFGQALGGVLSQSGFGQNSGGGLPGLGGLGGLSGGLGDLMGKAAGGLSQLGQTAPGGMGGLMGAGALGAVLGNLLPGNAVKAVAMAGAAAAAWNFFRKWTQEGAPAEGPINIGQARTEHLSQDWGEGSWPQEHPQAKALDAAPMSTDKAAELVARAMVYAAKADGQIDSAEQQRMEMVLAGLLPEGEIKQKIAVIKTENIDPAKLAAMVSSPEQAEDVYRLSCAAIDIDHFMETSYLAALANALNISPSRKKEIEAEAEQVRKALEQAVNAA